MVPSLPTMLSLAPRHTGFPRQLHGRLPMVQRELSDGFAEGGGGVAQLGVLSIAQPTLGK